MTIKLTVCFALIIVYFYGCDPGLKPGEMYTPFPDGAFGCASMNIIYYNLTNDSISIKINVNIQCETGKYTPSLKFYRDTTRLILNDTPYSVIKLNPAGKSDTILNVPPFTKIGLLCPGKEGGSCSYTLSPPSNLNYTHTDTSSCTGRRYLLKDSTGRVTFQINNRCGDVSAEYCYASRDSIFPYTTIRTIDLNDLSIANTVTFTLPLFRFNNEYTYLLIKCGKHYFPGGCFITFSSDKISKTIY